MRFVRIIFTTLIAIVIAAIIAGYGYYRGWHIERLDWPVLAAQLEPGFEIFKPDESGKHPTVIGFHGCSGMLEGNRDLARYLADNGFAVVLVDSMSFRKLKWQTVCAGHALWGNERVGDVFASIQRVRKLSFVDSNKLFLIGWSHGGWAVMDALYTDSVSARPPNLASVPDNALDGVKNALIFYPFCEFPALSRDGWEHSVASYFIFAENDSIVSNQACLAVINKLQRTQQTVESYIYPGLDHAFDMRTSDFYEGVLQNDAAATQDVHERVLKYLKAQL